MAVKRRYFLFLCSHCGEQNPFAGFCESCGSRLEMHAVIPVAIIEEFRSPSTDDCVQSLLEFATASSTC